jgi:hypothetical protein
MSSTARDTPRTFQDSIERGATPVPARLFVSCGDIAKKSNGAAGAGRDRPRVARTITHSRAGHGVSAGGRAASPCGRCQWVRKESSKWPQTYGRMAETLDIACPGCAHARDVIDGVVERGELGEEQATGSGRKTPHSAGNFALAHGRTLDFRIVGAQGTIRSTGRGLRTG